jgi:YD repeat-containing protein
MTVRSFLLRLVVFIAACGALLAALTFGGPIMSGAFFFASSASLPARPHPLPPDYQPLHKGHIDLSTGLYVREDEDLVLPGTPSFVLRRTYRTEDRQSRAFGVGSSNPGEWYLYGDGAQFQWAELIKEDGARVHFDRTSRGHGFTNAVYQTWTGDPEFYGSRLGWAGLDWVLRLPDGSFGRFRGCGPAGTVCTITMWRDADGHVIRFTRDGAGLLRRIEAGEGWIALDYDGHRRVSQARDNAGHSLVYKYDDAGRLRRAESSDGVTREYDYDAADRLTRIKDPSRTVENEYDGDGRCVNQRVTFSGAPDAEPYFFRARYRTEAERVVQVDVEEAGEPPVRYRFTTVGSLESETYNADTSRAVAVAYDFDALSHFVSGVTVTCAAGRWRASHSLPTTFYQRDETKARLIAQWCAPSM